MPTPSLKKLSTSTRNELSKEAKAAIRYAKISDQGLVAILNLEPSSRGPTMRQVRWMAYQILVSSGYEFEEV